MTLLVSRPNKHYRVVHGFLGQCYGGPWSGCGLQAGAFWLMVGGRRRGALSVVGGSDLCVYSSWVGAVGLGWGSAGWAVTGSLVKGM